MNNIKSLGLLASALLLAQPALADECDGYAQHLKTCAPFVCKFKHPFTGKMMQKEILGKVGGKCKTTEEMPNKGKMECALTPQTQAAVADELAIVAAAKTTDTEGTIDLASGKAKSTVKADGKAVNNALEDAMNSGECVVSGYD